MTAPATLVTEEQFSAILTAGEDASVSTHIAICDLRKLARLLRVALRTVEKERDELAKRVSELTSAEAKVP